MLILIQKNLFLFFHYSEFFLLFRKLNFGNLIEIYFQLAKFFFLSEIFIIMKGVRISSVIDLEFGDTSRKDIDVRSVAIIYNAPTGIN